MKEEFVYECASSYCHNVSLKRGGFCKPCERKSIMDYIKRLELRIIDDKTKIKKLTEDLLKLI